MYIITFALLRLSAIIHNNQLQQISLRLTGVLDVIHTK
jgi:hypothetical protein